jgi:SecD/SecF fusion protein
MTSRTRNLTILGLVVVLLGAAIAVILTKPTKLGLDLKGGIELVYQGRPTPQVPEVTQQALDDAVETIRKRTDALGVSEPEIQRSGRDQISIGLPAVQNADRAIQQVGTTAQLQFYDWEANVLGRRGPDNPYAGTKALYDATEFASTQKSKAEKSDVPPGSDETPEEADKNNNTAGDRYYLFGPDRLPIGPDQKPVRTGDYEPSGSCKELLSDYEPGSGPAPEYAKDTECKSQLEELGSGGPPGGSRVIKVPEGVLVVEAEPVENQPPQIKRFFVIEDDSELSGRDIKNPEQQFDPNTNAPIVTMEFTDKGREAFARVTKRLADRGSKIIVPPGSDRQQAFQRFAITLDDKIVSLATIDFVQNPEGIDGRTGAQIEGIGNIQETQDLAESLRIGALPIELKLISQTQVSATLGQQALHQGLTAAAVGLALTILFLLVFYRVLGVVATVALLIYAIFLFALVKLIPITLTLPGIAGMVLTLAVAADANIVMYERIKEEVRTGRSVPSAIAAGYSKALKTIIDANVVTIGVAFILFTLATAGVKGFAFTLGVGTLVSLFTAVLATSAILGTLSRTRLLRRPSALGVKPRERGGWKFDFMGKSRWFFSFSGVILAVGAIAISTLGLNFGIDFESGTRMTTPLERPASVDSVRQTLEPLGYGDAKIQEVDDPELGSNVIQISVSELDPGQVTRVERALDADFGVAGDEFSVTSVGPTFGEQIARTAVLAVIASLLLISLYIGFRFEFKFAVPVLIALAHDLLITAGVYALFDREVTTSTVAALLTIMGYSLYDTVIVFDRIRENVPRMPRATFSQIANRSMSEVFTRSLATSFVVLMPVGALLLFGGETLKDFAFALLVGVASGAYSSIFIASPVLVEWKEREQTYMRRRRLILREHGGVVPAFPSGVIGEPAPAGAVAGAAAGAGAAAVAVAATAAPDAPAESRRERTARRAAKRGAGTTTARPAPPPETAPPPDTAPPPTPPSAAPPPTRPAPPPTDGPAAPASDGPGAAPAERPTAPAPDRPAARPGPGRSEPTPAEGQGASPVPPAPGPKGAEPAGDGGDGAPAAGRAQSRVTSTSGPGKSKRRQRARKKHGRR